MAAAPSQPSLFGSSTATAATGGGGLFGATTTSQPQQTGGGLFGSGNTAAAQPSQGGGGGLFNTTAPQPASTAGGGLFSNAQNPGASLFGGGGGNTNTANTGTSSLFGQRPAQTGGLFGGQPTTQPAQASSGGFLCAPSLVLHTHPDLSRKLIRSTAVVSASPRTSSNNSKQILL